MLPLQGIAAAGSKLSLKGKLRADLDREQKLWSVQFQSDRLQGIRLDSSHMLNCPNKWAPLHNLTMKISLLHVCVGR